MVINVKKEFSKTTICLILFFWGLGAGVAAIYIPYYDFGLDGVKIWLFIYSMRKHR